MKKKYYLLATVLGFLGLVAYGASSFTTHYHLEKPADGDSGWGSAYRTSLDTIDTDLYAAINGLSTHEGLTTGAHAATAISTDVGSFCTTAINAQTYLACLDSALSSIIGGQVVTTNTDQTITGAKTFTQGIVASGGVLGNLTGNADTATALATAGTTSTVLHGNAGGAPTYGSIVNADVGNAAAISSSKLAMSFSSPLSISTDTVSIQNAAADGSTKGAASFTAADFNASSGNISIDYANGQPASASVPGFLSSADWSTFNSKQAAGDYSTSGSGDVAWSAHSGGGAVTTAIGNNKVSNAMLAQVSTATFKGRTTAATGNVEDLTVAQATALLNAYAGDSGSGGTKGLVPAPASGDAAAGKFLFSDGTWSVPAGAGNVTGQASSADGEITLFSGTGGKTIKRATGTGVVHATSGVYSASAVALASDVSGNLPYASLAQGAALSVLGNGTNATANNADITAGSDKQVLRRSGTAVGFGAIDVSSTSAVANQLAVGNGGTGIASGTSGGIPYFSGTTTIASSGALGSNQIVMGGGAGNAPTSMAIDGAHHIPPATQVFAANGTYSQTYAFIVTSAAATAAATYTNNAVTFTVVGTIASGTLLYATGSGPPAASGTLTKATGTGDSTITFTSFRAPLYDRVFVTGSGGAGGGFTSSTYKCGSGGSGGATAIAVIPHAGFSATETITVGAAVTGGTGNGGNGNQSSFGSHVTANGGTGGTGNATAQAGTSGATTTSGADYTISGGAGSTCIANSTATLAFGGTGGSSQMGGGGPGVAGNTGNGLPGIGCGGGGGGAATAGSSQAGNGGNSLAGCVVIQENYQ